MKKIAFVFLLSCCFSSFVFSQAGLPVSDIQAQALLSTLIGQAVQAASTEEARNALKLEQEAVQKAQKIKTIMENIQKTKDVLDKVQVVGDVVAAGGQNAQDLLDTVNDISQLTGGSIIFNKSIEELTDADAAIAKTELGAFRQKAIDALGNVKSFSSDMNERMNSIFKTKDALAKAVETFGGQWVDPNYQVQKEMQGGIDIMNRQFESLITLIQGQNIADRVREEAAYYENLLMQREKQKQSDNMKEFGKIDESVFNEIMGDPDSWAFDPNIDTSNSSDDYYRALRQAGGHNVNNW